MKHIDIPEPCSENWNEMTPNERGAFCQKCSQDVYDFTGKSADEIKLILAQHIANPVCMRIAPKQLNELNEDFSAWKIQNKQSYQRAWIFTLLVVFGMTLFSCEEEEEPVVKEYQRIGQTILNLQDDKKIIDRDTPENVGKQEENTTNESQSEVFDLPKLNSVPVMGKPIVNHGETQEMVCDIEGVVVAEKIKEPLDIVEIERYTTAGVPDISPHFEEFLIDEYEIQYSELNSDNSVERISAIVYPNPASTQTTLSVTIPRSGKTEIELIDVNGQRINTIHSGRIKKGESEYSIDLTDLETGMYLIVIQSGKLKETVKFSKL